MDTWTFGAEEVRSEQDRRLFESLLADRRVAEVVAALQQREHQGQTRRSLLARALRLSPEVAPMVHKIVDECRERLGVETEVELYVYASPQFNAACTQPERGRVFVLVGSSLLEGFDEAELRFVLGHELGHHRYDHHSIPLHVLLDGQMQLPARLVLTAHCWQRHAEISADRAGLLCCGGLDPAARALFKLSSGLKMAPDAAGIEAFLAQAEDLFRESQAHDSTGQVHRADWLSSHPFSPIRLRAAQAFSQSEALVEDGEKLASVEVQVLEWMALMEPSYLEEDSEGAEAMRRLLFAAAIVVAGASGDVSPAERKALESLLGAGTVPAQIDPERLRSVLSERIDRVVDLVAPSRRAQVVRDLALIARADGHVDPQEVSEVEAVADGLGVDKRLVAAALASPVKVD